MQEKKQIKEDMKVQYTDRLQLSDNFVKVIFRDENRNKESIVGEEFADCGELIRVTYYRGVGPERDIASECTTYINKKNVVIVYYYEG